MWLTLRVKVQISKPLEQTTTQVLPVHINSNSFSPQMWRRCLWIISFFFLFTPEDNASTDVTNIAITSFDLAIVMIVVTIFGFHRLEDFIISCFFTHLLAQVANFNFRIFIPLWFISPSMIPSFKFLSIMVSEISFATTNVSNVPSEFYYVRF